jgi:hypothetical protein
LVVIKKINERTPVKRIVVVLNANRDLKDFLRNILKDLIETVIPKRKPTSSAGHRIIKQSSPPALSAKILATGLLSVLCGLRLNSKIKLWIYSSLAMILPNGN